MIPNIFHSVCWFFVGSTLFLTQCDLFGITNPTLVSDSYGNSICVEIPSVNCEGGQDIRATYKHVDSDWQVPEIISDGFSYKDHFKVQKDREENVFVTWIGLDRSNETYSLFSNTWIASKQCWIGVSRVSNRGKMLCGKCSISMNEEKTLIMWSEYDPSMKPVTYVKEWIYDQWHHSSSLSMP